MRTFHYFAYGSNMLTERLRARCPSARPLGPARAAGHDFAIGKRGGDASGKATIARAPSAAPARAAEAPPTEVHGVVFEVDAAERPLLDRVEGPGYTRDDGFDVSLTACGSEVATATYIARSSHFDPGLPAFCWYRALILAGAHQHELPERYIERLAAQPFAPDPDPARAGHVEARTVLKAAGFDRLLA